jgi:hypothetical protein
VDDQGMVALIAGGYGVFGQHLARELLETTELDVIIAGRDRGRAEEVCRALGSSRVRPLALDLSDARALTRAAADCSVVACTAGPFQKLPPDLPRAAVDAGAHWVDVADAPGWVLPLLDDRSLDTAAAAAGVAVMPGLSTVPALSGMLATWCAARLPGASRGRVTLFIGNRNPKGTGATASALINGFRDPSPVDLPLGRRLAYRFDTADQELFRRDLGIDGEFRVALEWRFLGPVVAGLSRLARRIGPERTEALARGLSSVSAAYSGFGIRDGIVQVELWDPAGRSVGAALVAGQRMVVLPCAMAISSLHAGSLQARGVLHPVRWRQPEEWLAGLRERGVRLFVRDVDPDG